MEQARSYHLKRQKFSYFQKQYPQIYYSFQDTYLTVTTKKELD